MILLRAGRELGASIKGIGQAALNIDKIVQNRRSVEEYEDYADFNLRVLNYAADDSRDPEQLMSFEQERIERQSILLGRNPGFRQDLNVLNSWFDGNINKINANNLTKRLGVEYAPYLASYAEKSISASYAGTSRVAAYDRFVENGLVEPANRSRSISDQLLYNRNLSEEESIRLGIELASVQRTLNRLPSDSEYVIKLLGDLSIARHSVERRDNYEANTARVGVLLASYESVQGQQSTFENITQSFASPASSIQERQAYTKRIDGFIEKYLNSNDINGKRILPKTETDTVAIEVAQSRAKLFAIEQLFEEDFNIPIFAQKVLGKNFSEMPADERNITTGLFLRWANSLLPVINNEGGWAGQSQQRLSERVTRTISAVIGEMGDDGLSSLARLVSNEESISPGSTLAEKRNLLIKSFADNNSMLRLNGSRSYFGRILGVPTNVGSGDINSLRKGESLPEVVASLLPNILSGTADNTSLGIWNSYRGERRLMGLLPGLSDRDKAIVALHAQGIDVQITAEGDRETPDTTRKINSVINYGNNIIISGGLYGKGFDDNEIGALSYDYAAKLYNDGFTNPNGVIERYLVEDQVAGLIGEMPSGEGFYLFNSEYGNANTNSMDVLDEKIFIRLNGRPANNSEKIEISTKNEDAFKDKGIGTYRIDGQGYTTLNFESLLGDAVRGGVLGMGHNILNNINEVLPVDAPDVVFSIDTIEKANDFLRTLATIGGTNAQKKIALYESLYGVADSTGRTSRPIYGGFLRDISETEYTPENMERINNGLFNLIIVGPDGEDVLITDNGAFSFLEEEPVREGNVPVDDGIRDPRFLLDSNREGEPTQDAQGTRGPTRLVLGGDGGPEPETRDPSFILDRNREGEPERNVQEQRGITNFILGGDGRTTEETEPSAEIASPSRNPIFIRQGERERSQRRRVPRDPTRLTLDVPGEDIPATIEEPVFREPTRFSLDGDVLEEPVVAATRERQEPTRFVLRNPDAPTTSERNIQQSLYYLRNIPKAPDGRATTMSGEFSNGAATPYSELEAERSFNNGTIRVNPAKIRLPTKMILVGTETDMNRLFSEYLYNNVIEGESNVTYDEFIMIRLEAQSKYGVLVLPPVESEGGSVQEAFSGSTNILGEVNRLHVIKRYGDAIRNGNLHNIYLTKTGIR